MTFLRGRILHAAAVLSAAAMLAGFSAGEAHAAPTYDVSIMTSITINGYTVGGNPAALPATLGVTPTAEVVPTAGTYEDFEAALLTGNDLSGEFTFGYAPGATAAGNGTASVTPGIGGIGTGISLSAGASGSAAGVSESLVLQLTQGGINFVNSGAEAVTVELGVNFLWSIVINGTTWPNDYAEGIASILLDAMVYETGTETDPVTGWPIAVDLFETPLDVFEFFATDLGDSGGADSGGFTYFLTVGAGQSADIILWVDAAGYASSIPAPASALLLAFGLAALRRVRNPAGGHA